MSILTQEVEALLYLFAAVCFILALRGLSSPKSARRGNLLGALGALVGVVTVFLAEELSNVAWILIVIAVGSIISVPASRMVQMTQMPQLVALFNGVGGGAAAVVAFLELSAADTLGFLIAVAFTIFVGSVSFSGSVITFAKLQELMTTRPVMFKGQPAVMVVLTLVSLVGAVWLVLDGSFLLGTALMAVGLIMGVLVVLPVGGADVPIVISLLNAMTGLAVAASGLVLGNTLLLVAGTLVGASGTLSDQGYGQRHGPKREQHDLRRLQGWFHRRLDRGF
jgi:NAD(P) transhydrogenase subunit beta